MILAKGKVVPLFALIAFGIVMWIYLRYTKKGEVPWVKRLAAFDAIDEAIGRAEEMGKPVVMIPGKEPLTSHYMAQTVAGLSVLNYVARLCARYGAELWAPMIDMIVMPVAIENVRDAYLEEGKLDDFDPVNMVPYLSDSQFAWASGIIGYFARKKPAANIMIGGFRAETMMLAESGARIGAFQVCGTAVMYQIPFFAAVCDYTLIGEEIFAASAYLNKDPELLTTLATQDIFRIGGWVVMIVGAILITFGITTIYDLLGM